MDRCGIGDGSLGLDLFRDSAVVVKVEMRMKNV